MGKSKFEVCVFDRGRMYPTDFENHVNYVINKEGRRIIRVEPCTAEGTAIVVIEYEEEDKDKKTRP